MKRIKYISIVRAVYFASEEAKVTVSVSALTREKKLLHTAAAIGDKLSFIYQYTHLYNHPNYTKSIKV